MVKRQNTMTGQGIHTDGTTRQMLICSDRTNTAGAENRFYKDRLGNEPLTPMMLLEEGSAINFRDNKLFHYVYPATPIDKTKPMSRTMVIVSWPGDFLLTGGTNPDNKLSGASRVHPSGGKLAPNTPIEIVGFDIQT